MHIRDITSHRNKNKENRKYISELWHYLLLLLLLFIYKNTMYVCVLKS